MIERKRERERERKDVTPIVWKNVHARQTLPVDGNGIGQKGKGEVVELVGSYREQNSLDCRRSISFRRKSVRERTSVFVSPTKIYSITDLYKGRGAQRATRNTMGELQQLTAGRIRSPYQSPVSGQFPRSSQQQWPPKCNASSPPL